MSAYLSNPLVTTLSFSKPLALRPIERPADELSALRRARAESEALSEVARVLAGIGTDLDSALLLLAERTATLLDVGGVGISLLDGDVFHVGAAVGILASTKGARMLRRGSLTEIAASERRAFISNDLPSDQRADPGMVEKYALRQAAVAPMIVEGEVVGAILAVNSTRGGFIAADGSLLQRIADHGALAVRNTRLMERAERNARAASALSDIVQRINGSLELDQVFTIVVRYATELVGGIGAVIGILDGDKIVIVAGHGEGEQEVGVIAPVGSSFGGECARTGRTLRTDDMAAEGTRWEWSAKKRQTRGRNAVAAPLMAAGRSTGAVLVFGNESRRFDESDEVMLLALANHAAVAIENARLFRASERALKHANMLALSARSIALNVTAKAVYADIARIARRTLGADGVSLYLGDPLSGRIQLPLAEGIGASASAASTDTFWKGARGQMLSSGEALYRQDISDLHGEPGIEALRASGIISLALLPLMVEGKPRGVLALRFLARQQFGSDQRQMLADFSMCASIGVRNALLFSDVERRAARMEAVATVQRAISGAVSRDTLYHEIYKAVSSVVDAAGLAVIIFDEKAEMLVPEYVVHAGVPVSVDTLPKLPLTDGTLSRTLRTGEPVVVGTWRGKWSGQTHTLPGDDAAVVLNAPIVHGDRVLGVLQASSYRPDAYDWDDVELIGHIARQAGTAIVNARVFEAERQERHQAEAAAAVARVALRSLPLAEAANELLTVIGRAVRCDGSALAVRIGGDISFRYIAASGTAENLLGSDATIPDSVMRFADLADAGSLADEYRAKDSNDWIDARGSFLPLFSENRLIGALAVSPPGGQPMGSSEYAALDRLATPIALALATILLRAEEERQQAKQRLLASALETMPQSVFVCSPDGIIRYANGAATREFGYTHDQLSGLPAQTLLASRDSEIARVRQSITSGAGWSGEQTFRRQDGTRFPAWVTMSTIHDASERRIGLVWSARNLTEERRVAEHLKQGEKLAALGELVAGVAHEVNNPLTGISAFAQILSEEDLGAENNDAVRLIKREADRAGAVVKDLLSFARKSGPRSVTANANDLIQQTLRLRSYAFRSAGLRVETCLSSDLKVVQVDDRQIQQVLLNLMINAEHAMASVSRRVLTLRSFNSEGSIVIEIEDTGIGINQDLQHRIFEPFFTTKPEGTGTGLGLSVSFGIVQAHGGTLSVESSPGAGSTFRITLPCVSQPVVSPPAMWLSA